ncbi:MAG: Glu-tRNA(Gln) amidotransferase subunit GatD [Nitrososphaerota archaeon]
MTLEGYRGKLLEILSNAKCSIGDDIVIVTESRSIEGVLMPRYQYADAEHLVLKLKNGYNIGISADRIKKIKLIGKGKEPSFATPPKPEQTPGLPKVLILGTGGTIASRIDYRTGGVRAVISSEELYHLVPELSSIAEITTDILFNIYSENMTSEHWSKIATRVAEAIRAGYDGVVITHGTDTLHYTSAALTFALESPPLPVVLVGAQRSSDRPSSDSASNLIGAVKFAAESRAKGVFVVMHDGPSDDELAVHSGVRVRKLHTSRRDAFKSVNSEPVARVKNDKIEILEESIREEKESGSFRLFEKFDDRAALLKVYPGFHHSIIKDLVDNGIRGFILEGTGLGHAPKSSYGAITYAMSKGAFVGMTSQCINGSVRMTVYDTGRDLLSIGVKPLGDMLSEVALAKLMWALGNFDTSEVGDIMTKNLRGEMQERRLL